MPDVSRGVVIQAFVSLAVTLLVMGVALFFSAGHQWAHGLWFMAVFLFFTLIAMTWLWRVNPEIFVARRRPTGPGTKGWDLVLLWILLGSYFATLIVAALDDGRFHWAPAPPWTVLVGYALLLVGYLGSGWAQVTGISSLAYASIRPRPPCNHDRPLRLCPPPRLHLRYYPHLRHRACAGLTLGPFACAPGCRRARDPHQSGG